MIQPTIFIENKFVKQPSLFLRILLAAKIGTRSVVRKRPNLLLPFCFGLRKGSYNLPVPRIRALFKDNYDVLVDGYWRSGNTFISAAISRAFPHLRIRTHCHSPMYVIKALATKKQIYVVVREPQESIASAAFHFNRSAYEMALEYCAYYEEILDIPENSKITVILFRNAVEMPERFIEQIARNLDAPVPSGLGQREFWQKVEEDVRMQPWGDNPLTVSLPSKARREVLDGIKQSITTDHTKTKLLMIRAQRCYIKMVTRASNLR